MRINQFIAQSTGKSRREADKFISSGDIQINGRLAKLGDSVDDSDEVTLRGRTLSSEQFVTIMLHKPVGYVCSRDGQGSKTIYELLPKELHKLKPIGRLDKNSSGLILLTNDGNLAQELSHPSKQKEKVYEVELSKPLKTEDQTAIEQGIDLEDGPSKLVLSGDGKQWTTKMSEGRNRQIRRTFEARGYRVTRLHRIAFGPYQLTHEIDESKYKTIE